MKTKVGNTVHFATLTRYMTAGSRRFGNRCNSSCHDDYNIRDYGALCRHMFPGRDKPISTSAGAQLPSRLPNYVLGKFLFHRQVFV